MGWETPKYHVPNMWEVVDAKNPQELFYKDIDIINKLLNQTADELKLSNAAREQFIKNAWDKDLRPEGKLIPRMMYQRMYASLTGKNRNDDFGNAMARGVLYFIRDYRVFLAQDALNAYDAWKDADERYPKDPNKAKNMMFMGDIGTPPPDFSGNAAAALITSGVGLGAAAAAQAMGATITVSYTPAAAAAAKASAAAAAKTAAVTASLKGGTSATIGGATTGSAGAAVVSAAPPLLIATVAAVVASATIDRFVNIVTARPKLEGKLREAHKPFTMKSFMANEENKTELMAYLAMIFGQKYDRGPLLGLGFRKKENPYYWAMREKGDPWAMAYYRSGYGPKSDIDKFNEAQAKQKADLEKQRAQRLKDGMPLPKPVRYERVENLTQTQQASLQKGQGAVLGKLKMTQPGQEPLALTWEELEQLKITPHIKFLDPLPEPIRGTNEWQRVQETPRAMRQNWAKVVGKARDIAVADDGTVWLIGDGNGSDFPLFKSDTRAYEMTWEKVYGQGTRIAAGETAWHINSAGQIWRLDPQSQRWQRVQGPNAIDIGASGKHVWLIGGEKKGNDYQIFKREGNKWVYMNGLGVRIDVDAEGNPFIVNSKNEAWLYWRGQWHKKEQGVTDVGLGSLGAMAMTGANNGKLLRQVPNESSLKQTQAQGQAVAVGPDNKIWLIGPKKGIYKEK